MANKGNIDTRVGQEFSVQVGVVSGMTDKARFDKKAMTRVKREDVTLPGIVGASQIKYTFRAKQPGTYTLEVDQYFGWRKKDKQTDTYHVRVQ